MEKYKQIHLFDKIILFSQLIFSGLFLGMVMLTGFLPFNYVLLLGAILLLLFALKLLLHELASRNRTRQKQIKGTFLSILLIVLLLVSSFFILKASQMLDKLSVSDKTKTAEIDVTKPFNIYFSGVDSRDGKLTEENRSDVNIIVTVNPETRKILLTTTPRDYYVTIPEISGDKRDKLTHAGFYGVKSSIATLENLYDTDIPFYGRVNFAAVRNVVDALGGIDVVSSVEFTTSKAAGTVVKIKKGTNHLNGKQALAFVRERKSFIDGDHQRGKNQQALLTALIKKVLSPEILLKTDKLIDSLSGNAETNLSEKQMKQLIRFLLNNIHKMDEWEIETVAATGTDCKQYCYTYSVKPLYVCVPYDASAQDISQKIEEYLSF